MKASVNTDDFFMATGLGASCECLEATSTMIFRFRKKTEVTAAYQRTI